MLEVSATVNFRERFWPRCLDSDFNALAGHRRRRGETMSGGHARQDGGSVPAEDGEARCILLDPR